MITLIIGEPDSGKSALAEELAMQTGDVKKYYLATMEVSDEKAAERVKKHRRLREGKGFVTIERTTHVSDALGVIEPAEATVLLECVSNLVGNEMHVGPEQMALAKADLKRFANEIAADILKLSVVSNLILVTNEFWEKGDFDEETRLYVRLCSLVNERLKETADRIEDVRLSYEKDSV